MNIASHIQRGQRVATLRPVSLAVLAAILFAIFAASVTMVAAQSPQSPQDKPRVVAGPVTGEVVVHWNAVRGAGYYRIGWVSKEDYEAAVEASEDWLNAFTSVSVANSGQVSHTIAHLTPGASYWFIVGSSGHRYGTPKWGLWSELVTLPGGPAACAGDRDALTALYDATDGPNWRNSVNWLSDTAPIDEWFGVSTDADGCVLVLYLDSNDLAGTIPAQLAALSRLRSLHLGNNDLTGAIPPDLAGLDDLRVLRLVDNELSGEISSELGNMARLSVLDLDGNELTGPIPLELTNLTELRVLSLNRNMLSGPIPAEFGAMTNLTNLELWQNELTGELPTELSNLVNIRTLDVDENQLTGTIPVELGNLTNLKFLWLRQNQFTGEIPVELNNLSNLVVLGWTATS